MFGLSEAHYNIVKQQARRCSEDIKEALAGGKKYDDVAAHKIDMHYDSIKVLVTRTQFVWIMGYLAGRFGKDGEYE